MGININPYQFSLTTKQATNLIDAADGMKAYTEPPAWTVYPEKRDNDYEVSFKNDCTLFNEDEFVKKPKKGYMTYDEKNLAANQITYDTQVTSESQIEDRQNNRITTNVAKNALMFLHQIFWGPNASKMGEAPSVNEVIQAQGNIEAAKGLAKKRTDTMKEGMLRPELDLDEDGKFSSKDVSALAALDGESRNVTSRDFEIALKNYQAKQLH